MFAIPTRAYEVAGSRYSIGSWTVAAFADDRTGAFTHCAILQRYTDGHNLMLAATTQSLRLSIAHPQWRLPDGARYQVDAWIDGAPFGSGTATVIHYDQVVADLIVSRVTLDMLARGNWLTVAPLNVRFSLAGSRAAIAGLARCWNTYAPHANPFAGRETPPPSQPMPPSQPVTNPFSRI